MGSVQLVELLKLRVVPELLYVLQELGVLSSAAKFHRATTQVSTGTNQAMVATTYTNIDNREKITERGKRQLVGASGRRRATEEEEAGSEHGKRAAERRAEEEAEEAGGRRDEDT